MLKTGSGSSRWVTDWTVVVPSRVISTSPTVRSACLPNRFDRPKRVAAGNAQRGWLTGQLQVVEVTSSVREPPGNLQPPQFSSIALRTSSTAPTSAAVFGGQMIAIHGKTLRRSIDAASSKAAIQTVGTWATANHESVGQVGRNSKRAKSPKLQDLFVNDRRGLEQIARG